MTDVRIEPGLDEMERFFARRGWEPFPFQREAWEGYLAGQSGLITVPTGAGKTYAAYGGPLAELAGGPGRGGGLRVLYITPLRAVSRDIELALRLPVQDDFGKEIIPGRGVFVKVTVLLETIVAHRRTVQQG